MKTKTNNRFGFQCPKCGGSWFNNTNGTIRCKDEWHIGCKFKGDSVDEWKYFVYKEESRTSYESKEEYDKARRDDDA